MAQSAKVARPFVTAPTVGATRGASLKLQIPIWISSVLAHGGLLVAFWAVLTLFGLTQHMQNKAIAAPTTTEPVVTKVDEPEPPDVTNPDVGTVSELPTQFNVPRIEEHSVPGQVSPTEDIGIVGAPEGPQRTLPAPPGTGFGQGGGLPTAEPGGTGAMFGTQGGYTAGLMNPGGFGGRSGATRERLLQDGGGNRESELAVARGLEWLAKHQAPDGRWSISEFHLHGRDEAWPAGKQLGNCGCQGGHGHGDDIAGTAFGLLPFLAGGQTHKPRADKTYKDYSKNVEAGLRYLMRKQSKEGNFGGTMYSHGLATIALCEAYGLTNDPTLKVAAQRAINYICEAQDPKGGGWRYSPRSAGDMSVSGWELMALKSAQMSGLTVPKKTMDGAEAFWQSSEVRGDGDGGDASSISSKKKGKLLGFSYTPTGKMRGGASSYTMTAVGLLGLEYMGVTPANRDLIDGVEVLKKYPPGRTNNVYYEYYATQVMHHMGGDAWQFWNLGPDGKTGIRDTLIAKQDKGADPKHAHQAGSWDGAGAGGGRLMATSLNLLSLEVYYRHLPLYRRELATQKEQN
jgi:hypothetical protein